MFDPCQALTLVPAADASDDQRASMAGAASLWNMTAATRLTPGFAAEGPRLPVVFQPAAPAFHGLYDDDRAVVYINRDLADAGTGAIVLAHEIGHAFGLLHVPRASRLSVMNAGNLAVPPTTEDAVALAALWGRCGD